MSSISAGTTSGTALVSTGDTTGTLDLKTGASATTALSIDASQNVGIGTSSPSYKLDVVRSGNGTVSEFSNGTSTISIYTGATSSFVGGASLTNCIGFDSSSNVSVIKTNNLERLYIDSSGNVGLGVTPSTWSTGKAFEIRSLGNGLFSDGTNDVNIVSNAYYNSGWKYAANGYANEFTSGNGAGTFTWRIAGNNTSGAAQPISWTTAMTLNASGNLGIGTSSPSAKLTVNDANGIPIRIGDISSAPVSQTAVYVGASTGALSGANGDLVLIPRTSDSRSILFYTGNGTAALRATLDSSGNLGLGVTPSAWQTTAGSTALQFLGSAIYGYRDLAQYICQNTYFDGLGWKYYASSIAACRLDIEGGVFKFNIAPSGTAGTAITFTQAMTLDASGNLGIGVTSMVGSNRIYSIGAYNATTGAAANVVIESSGLISRSTSARKYKRDIEPLTQEWADKVLEFNPVHYRSKCERDNPSYGYYGFIADDVAPIDPRYVSFGDNDEVEGFQYERMTAPLLWHTKSHRQKIEALEAENTLLKQTIADLTARIAALENK